MNGRAQPLDIPGVLLIEAARSADEGAAHCAAAPARHRNRLFRTARPRYRAQCAVLLRKAGAGLPDRGSGSSGKGDV